MDQKELSFFLLVIMLVSNMEAVSIYINLSYIKKINVPRSLGT